MGQVLLLITHFINSMEISIQFFPVSAYILSVYID